jgi:hypothetical protein
LLRNASHHFVGSGRLGAFRIQRSTVLISKPPKFVNPVVPVGETKNIAGVWDLEITYALGTAHHHLVIEQSGTALQGIHEGELLRSNLAGKVQADHVTITSNQRTQGQVIHYVFTGVVQGDVINGEVVLGEYGSAQWRAVRHSYSASNAWSFGGSDHQTDFVSGWGS